MPTELYRFHCTDGHELVTDLQGRSCASAAHMRRQEDRVALALMEAADQVSWARWQVEVYDPKCAPTKLPPIKRGGRRDARRPIGSARRPLRSRPAACSRQSDCPPRAKHGARRAEALSRSR